MSEANSGGGEGSGPQGTPSSSRKHPDEGGGTRSVFLGIRPEAIYDPALSVNFKVDEKNTFKAKVDVLEPLGPEYVAYLNAGEHNLIATIDNSTKIKEGQTYDFCVNLTQLHIFDAETEEAL